MSSEGEEAAKTELMMCVEAIVEPESYQGGYALYPAVGKKPEVLFSFSPEDGSEGLVTVEAMPAMFLVGYFYEVTYVEHVEPVYEREFVEARRKRWGAEDLPE